MSAATDQILSDFDRDLLALPSKDDNSLLGLRVKYLGLGGRVPNLLRKMGELPRENRPPFGQEVSELRGAILTRLVQFGKDV